MPTRDISNRRIRVGIGPASAISDAHWAAGFANSTELGTLLTAAPAIRWDGFDFAPEASDQVDDRSLDDDAASVLRGFFQAGGAIPFYFPKAIDQTSVLRDIFDLVSVRGTLLTIAVRVGWIDRRTAFGNGDNVSLFKVITDGFQPDTEGDGAYAYTVNMLPQGYIWPWTVVANPTPAAVVIPATLALGVGDLGLLAATYQSNDITNRAQWSSSDETLAKVDNRGIVEGIAAGAPVITATYPGGTADTCVVTVS